MSAIKLPVTVLRQSPDLRYWMVSESNGNGIAFHLLKPEADQIALTLNMHDDLVRALRFYARFPEQCRNVIANDMPGNMNDWHADIGNDAGDIARAALAKIESVNETKPLAKQTAMLESSNVHGKDLTKLNRFGILYE